MFGKILGKRLAGYGWSSMASHSSPAITICVSVRICWWLFKHWRPFSKNVSSSFTTIHNLLLKHCYSFVDKTSLGCNGWVLQICCHCGDTATAKTFQNTWAWVKVTINFQICGQILSQTTFVTRGNWPINLGEQGYNLGLLLISNQQPLLAIFNRY